MPVRFFFLAVLVIASIGFEAEAKASQRDELFEPKPDVNKDGVYIRAQSLQEGRGFLGMEGGGINSYPTRVLAKLRQAGRNLLGKSQGAAKVRKRPLGKQKPHAQDSGDDSDAEDAIKCGVEHAVALDASSHTAKSQKRARRKGIKPEQKEILQAWFDENYEHPYPNDKMEMQRLMDESGLTEKTILNWFDNRRMRDLDWRKKHAHRKHFISKQTKGILQTWFDENYEHPYPNDDEMEMQRLMDESGLTKKKILTWFDHRRMRDLDWRKKHAHRKQIISQILQTWFDENYEHPYPNDMEMQRLMDESGLTKKTILNWFHNRRMRDLDWRKKHTHRKHFISKQTKGILQTWFDENYEHPYPNDMEMQRLMDESGLTKKKISIWFYNRRMWRKKHKRESSSLNKPSYSISGISEGGSAKSVKHRRKKKIMKYKKSGSAPKETRKNKKPKLLPGA